MEREIPGLQQSNLRLSLFPPFIRAGHACNRLYVHAFRMAVELSLFFTCGNDWYGLCILISVGSLNHMAEGGQLMDTQLSTG
jgi:hypothetical protein